MTSSMPDLGLQEVVSAQDYQQDLRQVQEVFPVVLSWEIVRDANPAGNTMDFARYTHILDPGLYTKR